MLNDNNNTSGFLISVHLSHMNQGKCLFSFVIVLSLRLSSAGDDGEARRAFSKKVFASVFVIPRNSQRCSMLGSDAINDIIEPILTLDSSNGTVEITSDQIYQYTGFQGVTPLCDAVEIAFTSKPIIMVINLNFVVKQKQKTNEASP